MRHVPPRRVHDSHNSRNRGRLQVPSPREPIPKPSPDPVSKQFRQVIGYAAGPSLPGGRPRQPRRLVDTFFEGCDGTLGHRCALRQRPVASHRAIRWHRRLAGVWRSRGVESLLPGDTPVPRPSQNRTSSFSPTKVAHRSTAALCPGYPSAQSPALTPLPMGSGWAIMRAGSFIDAIERRDGKRTSGQGLIVLRGEARGTDPDPSGRPDRTR